MKLECPECKNRSIDKGFLNLRAALYCTNCFARYEYKETRPWLLHVTYILSLNLGIFLGLYSSSWIVFGITVFIPVILVDMVFPSKKQLNLVGLKAILKNDKNDS